MFGWFRKRAINKQRNRYVYDVGRQFSKDLMSSYNDFIKRRFGTLHDDYLNVLRGNLLEDMQRIDVPPLEAARANYKGFLAEVSALKVNMSAEVILYMKVWLENADEIGAGTQIREFIDTEIDSFCGKLSVDGLSLFTDYAVPLKDASDAWRKAYPEVARKWPDAESK
ncbi:hypothetical protein [Rhodoblastus sp.]|uniref:hypothetical protein n=1 Tax=Rhodoblastus sp. TaxID=1962975 RepID=UPI003F9498C4